LDKGLEETVPLALISPPSGAHLISGVGDIDGFRHDDLEVSPSGGSFGGVRFTTTRDLAFAGKKQEVMVRIGNGGKGAVHAAISEDGGTNWSALESDPPGGNSGQGRIAISADGSVIVWAIRGAAYYTADRGKTWNASVGFAGNVVAADPVNANKFYALDTQGGKLPVSSDGGRSFAAEAGVLPATPGYWRSGGGVLSLANGIEGDVWVGLKNAGLYHSTNGGAVFAKVDGVEGAEAVGFGKAAAGKSYPAVYLLGSIRGKPGRYRSDDAGKSWVRIDDDAHQFATANVPMIIGDPRVYGRVYVTTSGRGVLYGEPVGTR
jgi:photosystem II stability/assembly factor-like uncharacterized protein